MRLNRQSALRGLACAASIGCLAVAMPAYAQVTPERLANPEPENWLLPHGNYANWSYSTLDEINTDNVGDLHVQFMVATNGSQPSSLGGNNAGQRSWPLVVDGMMYVRNAWAQTYKIDLTTGRPVWVNNPELEAAQSNFKTPILLGDSVYESLGNMRLLRIDAESGETLFDVSTRGPDNVETAERQSGGALAINDKIVFGVSGPGMRGWVGAFSAETGDLAWRFYTVPAPGEPGGETWADDHNAYLTGGAGVWTTPAYDPATNLVYVGTGEPQPWGDPGFRPGDNLYSVSTLALNADTGALVWYFQEIPDESWDYDTVSPKMLYDIDMGGETRQVLGNFSRNGHFYTLDRATGEFLFAQAYRTDVNWTAGIDPKTGHPIEYDPTILIQTYGDNKSLVVGDPTSSQGVCPSFYPGAPTWWPPSHDPEMQVNWVQTIDLCMNQTAAEGIDPARTDLGGNGAMWGAGSPWSSQNTGSGDGLIIAVNALTGEHLAQTATPANPGSGGLLGTAGGLLFAGFQDGNIRAYSKETLEQLWSFSVGTAISGPPISFAVDGKQYVAVLVGGAAGGANAILGEASQVVVFGL